jgi:hypothetical protein
MRLFIAIIFILGSSESYSQKEDYNWAIGNYSEEPTSEIFGIGYFNFDDEGLKFKMNNRLVSFGVTNSAISDNEGNPLYYSNGMDIYDSECSIIPNGDSINYNNYWKLWRVDTDKGKISFGLRLPQGMIMLPYPGHKDSIIWIAANYKLVQPTRFIEGLFVGVVDTKKTTVISQEKFRTSDSLNLNIQACRHANGRDWWIVIPAINHNKYYTYLLDPQGMHFQHVDYFKTNYPLSSGQAFFSPIGDKYVIGEQEAFIASNGHLSIFDFDRSTGKLTNLRYKKHAMLASFCGCSFSPDGTKLYFTNFEDLFQLDMTKDNPLDHMKLIAKSDLFLSDYGNGSTFVNGFVFLNLAPDGKLYGPGGNTFHSHIIEYPDEEGEACNVRQHALKTVSNGLGTPNFPNFRLGPLDGSPADTLGLDNNPIAKFRYEADTADHLKVRFTDLSYFRPEKWTWDFGDGSTFEGKKPYWHEFPKNGTYNVCLTVSNENSSNTTCRLVTIGTTGIDDIEAEGIGRKEVVSIFPNPTEGPLLVTLSEYIPEKANFILYDMMGREVTKSRIYYGWNNYDLSNLSVGNYIYIVTDKDRKIGQGKVVRI